MTIKDDYETLLRRGMPEHADIFNAGSYLAHSACERDGRNSCLSHSDTRDLLTMHALRWWLSIAPRGYSHSAHFGGPMGGCRVYGGKTDAQFSGSPLDAIIAATVHLEPKNAD